MASGDKKRKGSAKKHNQQKYQMGNRLAFNRIRREIKNLRDNPRDIDGLGRCTKILVMGPMEKPLQEAIRASRKALNLVG